MLKLLRIALVAVPMLIMAAPASAGCTGCSTLESQPTLSNGGCADNIYNCRVWERNECDSVRLTNRNTCDLWFYLNPGTWTLYDSTGASLGTVQDTRIRVNTGIRANASNLGMLMAWSVRTSTGTRTGWLDTRAMGESTYGNYNTQPRDPGGEVSLWHSVPSDNTPYLDRNGNSLKVRPECPAGGLNATDYLGRSGRFNMIYNLPANDLVSGGDAGGSPTTGNRRNDIAYNFYRYKNVTSVYRKLWDCSSGSPVASSQRLRFLYGRMYERHIDRTGLSIVLSRRGWVAMPNLAPGAGTTDY